MAYILVLFVVFSIYWETAFLCPPSCHCYPPRGTAICEDLRDIPYPISYVQTLIFKDGIFKDISSLEQWSALRKVVFRGKVFLDCNQVEYLSNQGIEIESSCNISTIKPKPLATTTRPLATTTTTRTTIKSSKITTARSTTTTTTTRRTTKLSKTTKNQDKKSTSPTARSTTITTTTTRRTTKLPKTTRNQDKKSTTATEIKPIPEEPTKTTEAKTTTTIRTTKLPKTTRNDTKKSTSATEEPTKTTFEVNKSTSTSTNEARTSISTKSLQSTTTFSTYEKTTSTTQKPASHPSTSTSDNFSHIYVLDDQAPKERSYVALIGIIVGSLAVGLLCLTIGLKIFIHRRRQNMVTKIKIEQTPEEPNSLHFEEKPPSVEQIELKCMEEDDNSLLDGQESDAEWDAHTMTYQGDSHVYSIPVSAEIYVEPVASRPLK